MAVRFSLFFFFYCQTNKNLHFFCRFICFYEKKIVPLSQVEILSCATARALAGGGYGFPTVFYIDEI